MAGLIGKWWSLVFSKYELEKNNFVKKLKWLGFD